MERRRHEQQLGRYGDLGRIPGAVFNAMWDTLVMLTANYLHMIDNTKEDDDEVE